MKLKGIGVSSGISKAKVFKLIDSKIEISKEKADPKKELNIFEEAHTKTIEQIKTIKNNANKNLSKEELSIFDAHINMANDPELINSIKESIQKEKNNAIYATEIITQNYITMFEAMDDEYMQERALDIKDIAKRLKSNLANVELTDISSIKEPVIIVADDLTPSETAQINKKFVKGFVTNVGGKTSHAAIMARSLEVPAILGLKNITKKVTNSDVLAINGRKGVVYINPNVEEIKIIEEQEKEFLLEKKEIKKYIGKESKTIDNHKVELAANIGQPSDVVLANKNDAEAIGLFRSEFLYMENSDWPTEEEQFKAYKEVLENMNNKTVVIRTLDIGGDKHLEYFDFPEEMNPFLGYRAIRLTLDKKDIFKTQLRAMLRASKYGKLAIMFPMIATIDELLKAKNFLEKVKKDLVSEGHKIGEYQVGTMIEVPAAAIIADKIAKHVDFLSIGTNDLMQYSMAADRMNDNVSYLYQPFNPSILRLIKMTIDGGHKEGKWVGMCGEMAGDRDILPILLGLGLDEFSMSSPSILKARRLISKRTFKEAKVLAKKALNCETEEQVKKLLEIKK